MPSKSLRGLLVAAMAGLVASCSDQSTAPPEQGESGTLAPLYSATAQGATAIPGRYIVVFTPGTRDAPGVANRLVGQHRGQLRFAYSAAIQGFAADLTPQAVEAIRRLPFVSFVEEDAEVSIAETQTNATWGLDRIDQRDLPLSSTYTYNTTAPSVTVYIVDTGIRTTHDDFGGRASVGFDALGGNGQDCHGHGTHVAGTVGGATWGVAKQASLVAVRVLNCQGSGTWSQIIAGVDWVTANRVLPAVANMSLGGSASSSVDNAVANSISAGVTYAIAAGNSNANACNYSPARVATALTVGATTSSDARASFSNFGTCLDLFAPGASITSAWSTSNSATNTISGTSMAAPHVAGVAALYLQANPSASPAAVASAITGDATAGKVTSAGSGSPNLLLYSLLGGSAPPPPPPPPPDPDPAPCTGCEHYTGTLTGTGDYNWQPNGTYYFSGSGTHRGWLRGPSGTDFDLRLYKWTWFGWFQVASSLSPSSEESIVYNGTSGYYAWRVESFSGSGAYDFWLIRP